MKKIITCIFTALAIISFNTTAVNASTKEAGSSAVPIFRQEKIETFDYRIYTLRKFLTKFGSPLTPYSINFIRSADYYGLDYRMVPAISGVESTFGKQIPEGSYNAYGWVNGDYSFKSWEDSIQVVTKTLKQNYLDKGATSIAKISHIYAPPSTTWGGKVQYFMGKINTLPLSFDI